MIFFHDATGEQRVLTAEDFREILNERSLLRMKLTNARIRAERATQRCEKAQDEVGSLQLRLVSANKGWDEALDMLEVTQDKYEQAGARAQRAFDEAHLQRVRAERLEAIIDHMNSNLRYLADEADSSLLNDVEVNPSCEKP